MDASYPPTDSQWQAIIDLSYDIITWLTSGNEDIDKLQEMLDERGKKIQHYFDNIEENSRRSGFIKEKIQHQLTLDKQIIASAKAQQADILAKSSTLNNQRVGIALYNDSSQTP